MKKILFVLFLLSVRSAGAQNAVATWTPNPVAELVISYTIVVDANGPIVVQATDCSPTTCTLPLTLAAGARSIAFIATNSKGSSAPSFYAITVPIMGLPSKVAGIVIKLVTPPTTP